MELRTLRYFLAAAEEGNITRAAEALHLTQPTFSRQLMELERELGTTLFVRGKRALTLTVDGLRFRQRAEEIVELADRAEREFTEKAGLGGVVTLGATEAIGSQALMRFLAEFMKKYPLIQIDLYSAMADQVQDQVDRGLADIGLLLEPVDAGRYASVRLPQKETWGVLAPRSHPLAEKEKVNVCDLADFPLFLPKRENVRRELLQWMGKDERELDVRLYYNLLSNAALLVEEGAGCAVCLDGALSARGCAGTVFRPVSPDRTTRSVLIWKKERLFSPAAAALIEELRVFGAENG